MPAPAPARGRERWVINKLRALCAWYSKGLDGGSQFRVRVNTAASLAELARSSTSSFSLFPSGPDQAALTVSVNSVSFRKIESRGRVAAPAPVSPAGGSRAPGCVSQIVHVKFSLQASNSSASSTQGRVIRRQAFVGISVVPTAAYHSNRRTSSRAAKCRQNPAVPRGGTRHRG